MLFYKESIDLSGLLGVMYNSGWFFCYSWKKWTLRSYF